MNTRIAFAMLIATMACGPARAAATVDFADVVENALPGIVNITVWREGPVESAPENPVGLGHRTPIAGTGFAIDPSGLIVTNRHVIDGASTISVGFSDRSRARATVLAVAAAIDVAILRVEVTKPLQVLHFGDSDKLRVGQPIVCIGNPLGIGLTVTSGVVSALNRDIHKTVFDDFIQSDCAINPGNSGGPMMDVDGNVVGIDTANIDPYGGGSIGLGFALTSNDVAFVVPRLIEMGRVSAGWVGASMQDATPEIMHAMGAPGDHGFIVNDVTLDGPANRAGVEVGDIVLAFSGQTPVDQRALIRVIARAEVGSTAAILIWRNGKAETLALPVMELPGGPGKIKPPVDEKPPSLPDLGFRVEPIVTPSPKAKLGVVVTDVADDSIASEASIVVGSVILMMQQTQVGSPEDVAETLRQARAEGRRFVALLIRSKTAEQRWIWLRL